MSFSPKKNNQTQSLQYEIFESNDFFSFSSQHKQELNHSRTSLIQWRNSIYEYQRKVIENLHNPISQKSLLKIEDGLDLTTINPFLLTSYSINFGVQINL